MRGNGERVGGFQIGMSRDGDSLTRFFAGDTDDQRRTYDAILAWDDEPLEDVHDYIQWIFPLPERSGANPSAPVLDTNAINTIRGDPAMQARLRAGYLRMLEFYGFELRRDAVMRGPRFASAAKNWLHAGNHNHLRLTRMLRCLRVLGLQREAVMLFAALEAIYRDDHYGSAAVTESTYTFWKQAMRA